MFIYLDSRYPSFYHDDEHFENMLGYLGYLHEELFIMKRIGSCEVGLHVNQDYIKTYNKMHVGYRMQMEWGIGRLKRKMKWKWLMKRFNSTKLKYIILFKVTTILTKFLDRGQMDFNLKSYVNNCPTLLTMGGIEIYSSQILNFLKLLFELLLINNL